MSLTTIFLLIALLTALAALARYRAGIFNESTEDFWARIARWLLYTVLASLGPLILDYLRAVSEHSGRWPALSVVYARGELCIVAAALAGVALGELVGISEKAKVAKVVLGGLCGFAIFGGAGLYVIMKNETDPGSLVTFSFVAGWGFIATLFVATCSIAVAELKK